MAASSGQDEIVAVDLIEKQPVRLDVQIAPAMPVAGQGMILQARRKRFGGNEQAQHVAQFRHVHAPLLRPADVAAELPSMDRRPQLDPKLAK